MDAQLRPPLSPVVATARVLPLTEAASSPSGSRSRLRKLPLAAFSSSSSPTSYSVGSPIQLLRSNQQPPPQYGRPIAAVSPLRKPRPATAVAASTGASATNVVNALIAAHSGDAHESLSTSDPALARRSPTLRPATAAHDAIVFQRHAQRCAGCGAYAELCMVCFASLKQQDGAAYKKQIARSVEKLFARATTRAFTKMAYVILVWIFGTWKRETRQQQRRRALAQRVVATRRLQRRWRAWLVFVYERRILGAMLYAEQQQHETRERTHEIAQLHGDMYESRADARLHSELHRDALQELQQQLATQQRRLDAKHQELLALRNELHEARGRIVQLEKQSIDPLELARIRSENADAKKMIGQLASGVLQSLETQLELLTTSEGRQNLSGVLSKDVVQLLDRPECLGLFNPHVELSSIASATDGSSSIAMASYDAPVDRADRIVLQWVNFLVQRQQAQTPEWLAAPRVVNFHASLSDGRAWALLTKTLHAAMCRVRPKRPVTQGMAPNAKLEAASVLRDNGEDLTEIAMERFVDHMKREDAPPKRLELLVQTLAPALWMPVGLLSASDVLAGDAELNFATLAYLFSTASPCLDDAHYALCNDLKGQLASAKAKWRELREVGSGGSSAANGKGATMVASASAGATAEDAALLPKMKLALAQTLELKKRLDAEDLKAREGHLLWWKSARIVLRKCFVSYARLARGKAGVLAKLEAAQDENAAFRTVAKSRLADLELPFEDFAWELKMLQTFLGTVYCDLARIYRGYATRADAGNQWIRVADFMELLVECRVVDGAHVTAQDAQNVVRRLDPKLATGAISPTRAMTPSEFLEALIRMARRKYSGEHHRVTLSEALCLLVDNFILPFAFRADADVFRKQMEEPKIRRLLLKFADELRELYASYAVDDARRRAARKRPRVTAFGFTQCLLDRNVLDVAFTSDRVLAVVQRVARTSKKEADEMQQQQNGGLLPMPEDDELTFDEFQEALIVTACFKFPDPYISLESRVEKFLTSYLRSQGTATDSGISGKATPLE